MPRRIPKTAAHVQSQIDYIDGNRIALSAISFLPPIEDQGIPGVSLHEYLMALKVTQPDLLQFIDLTKRTPEEWRQIYEVTLPMIDDGGFDHGAKGHNITTGSQYGMFQQNPHYNTTRVAGVKGLWERLQPKGGKFGDKEIFLDALAGNGTFERVLARLVMDKHPKFFNHDVSSTLIRQGLARGQFMIRGLVQESFLKDGVVAGAVSAYGTHHIPSQSRQSFVKGVHQLLLPGGAKFVMQDFEEGGPTARFYSEGIDALRPGGHDYPHFTKDEMRGLLKTAGFTKVAIANVYDPYVFEGKKGQTAEELEREFYAYLIRLFTLEKLLPEYSNGQTVPYERLAEYEDRDYWRRAADTLKPYHTFPNRGITDQYAPQLIDLMIDGEKVQRKIPIVDEPTIYQTDDGRNAIAVPREALIGIGETREIRVARTALRPSGPSRR